MKREKQMTTGVAVLAAAALFGCGLWMLIGVQEGSRVLMMLTGGISLAAAALILALAMLLRQMLRREEELLDELDEQEEAHDKEMRRSILAARSDMEEFRDALAHSLRMPVAIIQGYAELLAGNVVSNSETRQEYLEKIAQRSQDLSEVVSRHFSLEESMDSRSLSYGDLDLLELVRRVAADMQAAAEEQGVLIQVLSPEDSIPVKADAYLLNRVLFNLLENALKYMGRPGAVVIRVLRQGKEAAIVVQDDGIGMPAQEVARVFEPHFQGSNRSGGRGYGLYQVQQAAQAHGGSAVARSAPGQGMGVTVTIPMEPKETAVAV